MKKTIGVLVLMTAAAMAQTTTGVTTPTTPHAKETVTPASKALPELTIKALRQVIERQDKQLVSLQAQLDAIKNEALVAAQNQDLSKEFQAACGPTMRLATDSKTGSLVPDSSGIFHCVDLPKPPAPLVASTPALAPVTVVK